MEVYEGYLGWWKVRCLFVKGTTRFANRRKKEDVGMARGIIEEDVAEDVTKLYPNAQAVLTPAPTSVSSMRSHLSHPSD